MESLGGKCPYELLGVPEIATEKEIKTAYKKTALKTHPDRNPDDPNAEQKFHLLVQAYELLVDEQAKAAYDKVLKVKKAKFLRDQQANAATRKLREELERDEELAAKRKRHKFEASANDGLKAEIERIRDQTQRRLQEERKRFKPEAAVPGSGTGAGGGGASSYTLQVKWKYKGMDVDNGGYTKDAINRLFTKYGDVAVLMKADKRGRAKILFDSADNARFARDNEKGLAANPFSEFAWVGKAPEVFESNACVDTWYQAKAPATGAQATAAAEASSSFEDDILRRMVEMQRKKTAADGV